MGSDKRNWWTSSHEVEDLMTDDPPAPSLQMHQDAPWLRRRLVEPDAEIMRATLEMNEAMIRKYNELMEMEIERCSSGGGGGPPVSLFNTQDIRRTLEDERRKTVGKPSSPEIKEEMMRESPPPPGFQPNPEPNPSKKGQKIVEPLEETPLELEAMLQYDPRTDSQHDMIFGNVMGHDYGGYAHGVLWNPNPVNGEVADEERQGLEPSRRSIWYDSVGGQLRTSRPPYPIPLRDRGSWKVQSSRPATRYPNRKYDKCGEGQEVRGGHEEGKKELEVRRGGRGIWGDVDNKRGGGGAKFLPFHSTPSSRVGLRRGSVDGCVSEAAALLILHRRPLIPTGSSYSLLDETRRQMMVAKRRGMPLDMEEEEDGVEERAPSYFIIQQPQTLHSKSC